MFVTQKPMLRHPSGAVAEGVPIHKVCLDTRSPIGSQYRFCELTSEQRQENHSSRRQSSVKVSVVERCCALVQSLKCYPRPLVRTPRPFVPFLSFPFFLSFFLFSLFFRSIFLTLHGSFIQSRSSLPEFTGYGRCAAHPHCRPHSIAVRHGQCLEHAGFSLLGLPDVREDVQLQ